MKKSKKAMIISLCLTPLLLLTACVPPPSYTISASSSDLSLGYIQGQISGEMEEGSKVTLTAVAKTQNPLVCWVKDNKKIISQESILELTYSDKTAGHYTAVFEESDISKMQYASLTDIDFTPSGIIKVNYQITTAFLTSGSSDYYEFVNGEYTVGQDYSVEPESVMYFGGAGQEYVYIVKIKFNLFDSQNTETSFEYTLQQKINKTTFNGKAGLKITEKVTMLNDAELTLTFQKLTTTQVSEFETITPEPEVVSPVPQSDIGNAENNDL